ncbi:MAG: hypothetical protein KGZ73_09255 [Rhizobiales bacterium]|nr:hypothetical protein [Hyphomicrobiales bacterium]
MSFLSSIFGTRSKFYWAQTAAGRFEFEFVPQWNGSIRLYINEQPSYRSRSADLQSTHRYEERGRYFVCIYDHLAPQDFNEAQSWANYFAARTSEYILFGHPVN